MNKRTALIIATIILLLVLGVLAYQNIKTTGKVVLIPFDYDNGFDYNDYCELNKTDEMWGCFPEDRCEFQEDSDGTKYCVPVWRE
jgi:hypothetical protein